MGRKDLPQALTLERFAAGKDGRANAFKKKKQANKRKLFEKAQLKRQYAKLLKKEATTGEHGSETPAHAETAQIDTATRVGEKGESEKMDPSATTKGKRKLEAGDRNKRENDRSFPGEGGDERDTTTAGTGKWKAWKTKRPEHHRPDPFKDAKAIANQRRQEAEEKQRDRDAQKAEKGERAKKRRKQHALLSKRTRGGQPVMKNTMQHLLEKIQSQR